MEVKIEFTIEAHDTNSAPCNSQQVKERLCKKYNCKEEDLPKVIKDDIVNFLIEQEYFDNFWK